MLVISPNLFPFFKNTFMPPIIPFSVADLDVLLCVSLDVLSLLFWCPEWIQTFTSSNYFDSSEEPEIVQCLVYWARWAWILHNDLRSLFCLWLALSDNIHIFKSHFIKMFTKKITTRPPPKSSKDNMMCVLIEWGYLRKISSNVPLTVVIFFYLNSLYFLTSPFIASLDYFTLVT